MSPNYDNILTLAKAGTLGDNHELVPEILKILDLTKWFTMLMRVDPGITSRRDIFGLDKLFTDILNAYEFCLMDQSIDMKTTRQIVLTAMYRDARFDQLCCARTNLSEAKRAFSDAALELRKEEVVDEFAKVESIVPMHLMIKRASSPTIAGIRKFPASCVVKDLERFYLLSSDKEAIKRRLKSYFDHLKEEDVTEKVFEEIHLNNIIFSPWYTNYGYKKSIYKNMAQALRSAWREVISKPD